MERLRVYVGREHSCCRGWRDRWGHCSPPNAWSPARHTQTPSADNPHRLTDVPALQTIEIPPCREPSNRIWARTHIYCAFKMCMDARRHCEERWRRGSPSSTHHSQNTVKRWSTTKMSGEEAPLARPRQQCKGSMGQLLASAEHSSVQPGTHSLARSSRGGWVGKSCLGKQPFPCLAWGSEIRPLCFWKEVILTDSMPVTNERLRKKGKGLTCILNLNTDIWHL